MEGILCLVPRLFYGVQEVEGAISVPTRLKIHHIWKSAKFLENFIHGLSDERCLERPGFRVFQSFLVRVKNLFLTRACSK